MLFKFGTFWKSLTIIVSSWVFYGIFGFEFTAITLLAAILAVNSPNAFFSFIFWLAIPAITRTMNR